MTLAELAHFTDPAWPVRFSAEPARGRLRRQDRDQLRVTDAGARVEGSPGVRP